MLPLTTLPSGRVVKIAPGSGLAAGAALPPNEVIRKKATAISARLAAIAGASASGRCSGSGDCDRDAQDH
jgi:hypothetical protein